MSKCYIFTEEELTALANSIRTKAGIEDKMTMSEMCDAIRAIESATVAKYGVTDTYDFGDLTETGTIALDCKLFPKYVGYKITSITNEGFRGSSIEEFDFPLLSSIGNNAFFNCTGLTNVEIAATVLSISDGIFSNCSNLENVEFKNAINSIPSNMFSNCIKLKDVILPSSVTSIGDNAFFNCSDLNLQELPNNLTSIGAHAFRNCVGLTINELPDSIMTLSSYAFCDCTNIEFDKLPANLTFLGSYVFQNCKKVTIHEMNNDNWTTLPNYVFSHATGITHFTLPSALSKVPSNGFEYCSSLSEVIFQHDDMSIGEYAFRFCTALEEIDLSKVKSISNVAFAGAGLKKLKIYPTTTSIFSSAFDSCTSLVDVDLSEATGLTYLTQSIFRNCTALKVITIPSTIKTIDSNAFQNCTGLKKIFFKDRPTALNSSAFSGCTSVTDIYVPWSSGAVSGAPWGAINATIHYDSVYDQDLISLSIDSGNILMTVGSTHQFEVVYNPDKDLVKEEQLGVTYSVISGSEYITVDNNGLATMIADAPEGTTMIVRATSTYNSKIYTDATLTVIASYVEVDLNNGQWVDTGTTVDGHIVYQSDAGSYHVNSGLSRMTVTFEGYTSITAYIRSFAEGSYDYTELGPLDGVNIARGAGTNVLSTSSKQSSSTYYSHTYENDGGKHSFEVIYSKDSSADSDDDRGYFYFVTN